MTTHKPIAVLLVNPSDTQPSANRPTPDSYRDLFVNDPESLHRYWSDVSDGAIDLQGTKVFGWRSHGMTRAAFGALSRADKIKKAVDIFANAAQPADREDLSGFNSVAVFGDPADDLGSTGINTFDLQGTKHNLGTSIFAAVTDHRLIAHELGHGFGFDHSFDDNPTAIDPGNDSRPGAYGDMWDIMSSANVISYTHPRFGQMGPGLNATMRDIAGWLQPNRIIDGHGLPAGTAEVFAVNDRTVGRPHVMRLDEFYFEVRMSTGWNRAMGPGVQVRVRAFNQGEHSQILHFNQVFGPSVFTMGVGDFFQAGNPLDIFGRFLKVTVTALNLQAGSATLSVSYRASRRPPVEGPAVLFGGVASDGGGWIFVNGHFHPVPPRSPREALVGSLAVIASLDFVQDKELRAHMIRTTLANMNKQVEQLGKELHG